MGFSGEPFDNLALWFRIGDGARRGGSRAAAARTVRE